MSRKKKLPPNLSRLADEWEELIRLAPFEVVAGRSPLLVVSGSHRGGQILIGFHPAYDDVEDRLMLLAALQRMVREGPTEGPFKIDDHPEKNQ